MIRVPLLNQGEEAKFIEVEQAKLPTDVSTMTNFLLREKASIEFWLEIAVSLLIYLILTLTSLFPSWCTIETGKPKISRSFSGEPSVTKALTTKYRCPICSRTRKSASEPWTFSLATNCTSWRLSQILVRELSTASKVTNWSKKPSSPLRRTCTASAVSAFTKLLLASSNRLQTIISTVRSSWLVFSSMAAKQARVTLPQRLKPSLFSQGP